MKKWTEAKDEQILRLKQEGFSAAEIAEQLGDTTRNAVIGRWRRLTQKPRHKTGDVPEFLINAPRSEEERLERRLKGRVLAREANRRKATGQTYGSVAEELHVHRNTVVAAVRGARLAADPNAAPAQRSYALVANKDPDNPGVRLLDLPDRAACRFPVRTEANTHYFCGKEVSNFTDGNCPYCDEHRQIAFAPSQVRKKG